MEYLDHPAPGGKVGKTSMDPSTSFRADRRTAVLSDQEANVTILFLSPLNFKCSFSTRNSYWLQEAMKTER